MRGFQPGEKAWVPASAGMSGSCFENDAPVTFIDSARFAGDRLFKRKPGANAPTPGDEPMAADGNITKDIIYEAVAPDDFEAM
ncbi:MAG: hypothetical protein V4656_19340, partial [Pseudomonadota bacterium]